MYTNINVPLEERVVDLKLMSERQHRSDQVMLGLGELQGTCVWVSLAREQVGALKRVPSCPDVDSKDVLAHAHDGGGILLAQTIARQAGHQCAQMPNINLPS